MKTEFRTRCLAIGIAALVCAAPSVMAKQIGTTAAVNPATFGTPPDGGRRTLMVGQGIVFKETIETEAGGQTQILFVDESTLTLGPNSNIVLDEFVYDPATSDGKLVVSMVSGALRFVGGKISKSGGMTIKTPAATIGIRGGICLTQSGTSGTTVICPFGSATVCPNDGGGLACSNPTIIDDAETQVSISPGGEVEVTEVDPDTVAELYSNFQGGESEAIDPETVEALVEANADPTDPVDPIVDPTPPPPENADPETETCVTCESAQKEQQESNIPDPTILIGGRVMLTPDPYTTDDGLVVSDPFADNF
ncbi:MAG: FecR family protein, partial [Alphaproteobacteria bacterium]|nr:FecR family protein [Alphaproteobacteria bacterium]